MKIASILLCLVLLTAEAWGQQTAKQAGSSVEFAFPKYAYKRNSVAENRYKNMANKCEFNTECANLSGGVQKENCVLRCISKQCYDEIYAFNPLEDGEIDQRIQSFKGCYAHFIES